MTTTKQTGVTPDPEAEGVTPEDNQTKQQTTDEKTAAGKEKRTPEEIIAALQAQVSEQAEHISTLNKENAQRRTKLSKFEKEQEERERAAMTETERLKADLEQAKKTLADAQAAAKREKVNSTILAEAGKRKFADPQDALLLITVAGDVELDEQGNPTNVGELLDKLAKDKPYMLAPKGAPKLPANNPGAAALGETDDMRRHRMFGGGSGPFSPQAGAEKGGGVFFLSPEDNK